MTPVDRHHALSVHQSRHTGLQRQSCQVIVREINQRLRYVLTGDQLHHDFLNINSTVQAVYD